MRLFILLASALAIAAPGGAFAQGADVVAAARLQGEARTKALVTA